MPGEGARPPSEGAVPHVSGAFPLREMRDRAQGKREGDSGCSVGPLACNTSVNPEVQERNGS